MSDKEMVERIAKRFMAAASKTPEQLAEELLRLYTETVKVGWEAAAKLKDPAAKIDMQRKVDTALKLLWGLQREYREKIRKGEVQYQDRISLAARQILDPMKPLEGNAVAYFTVGGDERDGDPESIPLRKGEVPVQEVMTYLHKRTPNAKAQLGHHPGEVLIHDIGWDKKPYSYITKVKVESRK